MGRPKKEINWDQVNKMLAMGLQKKHIIFFFGISEDTLDYRLRDDFGMTFTEYKREQRLGGDIQLVNVAWDRAVSKSDTLLKLFLEDRLDMKSKTEATVNVELSPDIVKAMAREYLLTMDENE